MTTISPEKRREYQQRYKAKAGVKEKYAELNKAWIAKNREQYNFAKSQYRFKLKIAALNHYSGGTMKCAHCGYGDDLDALCLDHINDDGAAHRKELGCGARGLPAGTTIYERLKAMGWIEGLQVLCFNCNTIKELRRKRKGLTANAFAELTSAPTHWGGQPRT